MPDKKPYSKSEKLLAELKELSERSERLRVEAKKNADEAALIIEKMATIQRRMIEEEAARAKPLRTSDYGKQEGDRSLQ